MPAPCHLSSVRSYTRASKVTNIIIKFYKFHFVMKFIFLDGRAASTHATQHWGRLLGARLHNIYFTQSMNGTTVYCIAYTRNKMKSFFAQIGFNHDCCNGYDRRHHCHRLPLVVASLEHAGTGECEHII